MPTIAEELSPPESRAKFIKLLSNFVNGMADSFEDCSELKDTVSKVKLMQNSGMGVDTLLQKWIEHLDRPLSQSVPYAAPLDRLLQNQNPPQRGSYYHAYAYNDVTTAFGDGHPTTEYINLLEKLDDPTFDVESRNAAMKYLRALNDAVYGCHNLIPPMCPTREELQEEINRHKKLPKSGELSGALLTSLRSIAEEARSAGYGKSDTVDAAIAQDPQRDWVVEWNDAMCGGGAQTLYDACSAQQFDKLIAAPAGLIQDLGVAALMADPDEDRRRRCQQIIGHINVLIRVHVQVPDQMRERLESAASRFAAQIIDGKMSMASLDLTQIGQGVLEGCDSDDLSALADNIGSLLPMLANMDGMPAELQQNAGMALKLLPGISTSK